MRQCSVRMPSAAFHALAFHVTHERTADGTGGRRNIRFLPCVDLVVSFFSLVLFVFGVGFCFWWWRATAIWPGAHTHARRCLAGAQRATLPLGVATRSKNSKLFQFLWLRLRGCVAAATSYTAWAIIEGHRRAVFSLFAVRNTQRER